ncbi:MAG: hypothetical protein MSH53_00605 [Solobacterium sp.]|nr:hypothetical protein [Solobacterium sp.]
MKTIRNNLWMVMVAWCLIIEGKDIFAFMVIVSALIYLYFSYRSVKVLETVVLSCLFISVGLPIMNLTSAGISFSSVIFEIFASINVSLCYEYLSKIRLKPMYSLFIIVFALELIMAAIFVIMPITLMNLTAKFKAVMMVNVIFMPYTLILLIRLIQREYRIRTLRTNLETLKKRSMFDIKI